MQDSLASLVEGYSAHTSGHWLYAWALGYAAIGAASLLVPLYALGLGGGPLVAGALEATAGLAGVPGALVWGRLADRTGHRRVFVLASLGGSGVCLLAFPLVDSLVAIVLVNTVLWFAVAAATPVVTLFVIERAAEGEWETRIGALNAYQRYGWVAGLVVGTAWLGAFSTPYSALAAQRSFFVVCAAGAVAAVPLAFYWLLPEPAVGSRQLVARSRLMHRVVADSGRYLRLVPYAPSRALVTLKRVGLRRSLERFSPALRRYFLAAFLFSCGGAVFFGPAPAFLVSLEYASALVFGFFILASLASAVAFVPVGRLAGRLAPRTLQGSALAVRVLLFPAIGLVGLLASVALRDAGLVVGFVLLGLTWAVIAVTGAGIVSRAATPDLRGEALGIYTAVSGVGGGVGGLLGGYTAAVVGYQLAFGAAGVLVAASAVVVLTLPVRRGEGDSGRAPAPSQP